MNENIGYNFNDKLLFYLSISNNSFYIDKLHKG